MSCSPSSRLKRNRALQGHKENLNKFQSQLNRLVQDSTDWKRIKRATSRWIWTKAGSAIPTSRRTPRVYFRNRGAMSLVKRLAKYRDIFLTFLECDYVPFDNNHTERSVRPAAFSWGQHSLVIEERKALRLRLFSWASLEPWNSVESIRLTKWWSEKGVG